MSTAAWLALCSLPVTLQAALAGVPEAPVPGTLPRAWLAVANDAFGIVATPDDYRTNQIALAVLITPQVILCADHSMLTAVPAGTRSDEGTVTVGWLPGGDELPWIVLGVGMKWTGDLGGEDLQQRWHEVIGMEEYDLAYETDSPRGVAYALLSQVWWAGERTGWAVTTAALATTGGEVQAEAVGWALYRRSRMTAWAGLRARCRGGSAPTRTAGLVADFEEGLWCDYGVGIGWFAFAGAYDPIDGVSSGTITMDLLVP